MRVPFLSLEIVDARLRNDVDNALSRVVDSGRFVLGDELFTFEREWAEYCSAKYCVGVGNGLDALQLSLLAAGIAPGDEVIVPANTYVATWFAISNVGAIPVAAPVEEGTYNIDPNGIGHAISDRTKAVIPVHLYGHPCRMTEILSEARRFGLTVIEDAAQAHGAKYKNQRIGSHGDFVAWSFYPGKNLGALGDGGAVTTNNEQNFERLRALRNYGSVRRYEHHVVGVNSRLDEIQAAVLSAKLPFLDSWIQHRKHVAERYIRGLQGLQDNGYCEITLPKVSEDVASAWHLFVMKTSKRDELAKELQMRGVETLIHYPLDVPRQKAYVDRAWRDAGGAGGKNSGDELLSLPMGPHLTDEQIEHTISSTIDAWTTLS